MLFCGNCGLNLTPGDRRCPRCGTAIDSDLLAAEENAQPDAPTDASPSLAGSVQPSPVMPPSSPGGSQPKLVLRSGQDAGNYSVQDGNEATYQVATPGYDFGTATQRAPANPDMPVSHPGYPQSGMAYPSQAAYPPQQAPYSPYPQGIDGYMQPAPPNYAPQNNMSYQGYSPIQAPRSRTGGRSTALVVVLAGLLLILVVMTLFILQRNGVLDTISNGGNSTATVAPATPEQKAQAFIQQYYDNVNKKDYPTAYNMWKDDPQKPTLATFENGYTNTLSDNVAFENVAALGDGTIRVPVTVNATEKTATGGTTNSTYKGYYIVGQQNNSLKILQGVLNKVS